MTIRAICSALIVCSFCITACGGGGSGEDKPLVDDSLTQIPETKDPTNNIPDSGEPNVDNPLGQPGNGETQTDKARYLVTLENLWGAEHFPQEFPDDGHLSLVGGATHNVAVSFWEPGELATRGIEDMAEAGLINKLLFDEVAPAITKGTADSMIEIREYTDAMINGVPGKLNFEIELKDDWPLVTLVTMLGPSPDWFVGVSGLSLWADDNWQSQLSIDLPLYDAGTKSDIIPVMGGPDIVPANPIGLVAYDAFTGVYLSTDEPQTVARLSFDRID